MLFSMLGLFLVPSLGSTAAQPTQSCVKSQINPVFTAGQKGSWDSALVWRQDVLMKNVTFFMLYSGSNGTQSAIGLATSSNGISWVRMGSPVLGQGPSGSWDSGGVYSPSVVWNGSTYLMYYTGTKQGGSVATRAIGVAFSKDLTHWVKYANNPVLASGPGTYDSGWVGFASVVFDAQLYRMWYTGNYAANSSTPTLAAIDYATSSDGLHWTKYQANPVLSASQLKDATYYTASYPSVIEVSPGTLLMAFSLNLNQGISYATSQDGLGWASRGSSLISYSTNISAWDSQPSFASGVLNGSELVLFYDGMGAIGVAYCPLVIVQSTATTVVTTTSTSILMVTPLTSVSSSGSSALQTYQWATAILGAAVVVLTSVIVADRIHRRFSDSKVIHDSKEVS
jgi:predicted GH43/DUF377 family glycosyl hydrolase